MKTRKILAYCLTVMLVIESILINLDNTVYSDGNAVSKRDDAIRWLKLNQNADGFWGEKLSVHETLEVLKNIGGEQIKLGNEIDKANEWLEKQTLSNNDYIFRFISTNKTQQNNGMQIIANLQNEDGGWGISKNYSSDVYDTLLSLDACMSMEEIPLDMIDKGIKYITRKQMSSGGFSYTDKTEDVYLTAYALTILSEYKELMGNTEDGVSKAITDSRNFLLFSEDKDELWGMEEDTINGTMMAAMALAESKEESSTRIGKIGAALKEDGSMYGSSVATAMYVKLTGMIAEGSAYAKIEGIRCYSDGMIGAGTDVHIEPIVKGYDDNSMSLEVMVGNADAGYTDIQHNGGYVWNTGKMVPGKYDIYAMLRDKNNGEIISVRKRIVNVCEDFKVLNTDITYEPKIPVMGVLEHMDFDVSVETVSNIEKEVEVCLSVVDEHGNTLHEETQIKNIGVEDSKTTFTGYGFEPEIEGMSKLYAQTRIIVDGEIFKVVDKTIRIHKGSDEGKIDADYVLSKDSVKIGEDEATVDFSITGVGMVMEEERKPVDLYITIDNSGSMEDYFENAKQTAIKIVSSLNEEDRCAVHFIDNLSGVKNFYGYEDKENLILKIEEKEIDTVWGTQFNNALNFAEDIFDKKSSIDRDKVYLLLSDGETKENTDSLIKRATRMGNKGITIHTIQLGGSGEELLRNFASLGNGKYQMCNSKEDLPNQMNGIAGEIFGVAGSDAALSMYIENELYENIMFSMEPDKVEQMEDGTTHVEWNRGIVDIAQIVNYSISYKMHTEEEGIIKLAKDVVFKYVSNYGNEMEVALGDINVEVESEWEMETEEETTSTQEMVTVEKPQDNTWHEEETVKEKDITGIIKADKWQMDEGDELNLEYMVQNIGDASKVNAGIKIEMINVETGQTSYVQNEVYDIAAAGEIKEMVELEGENIKAGEYIVTLVLEEGEDQTMLSATGFVILKAKEESTQNPEDTTTSPEEVSTTQSPTTDENLEDVTTDNEMNNNDESGDKDNLADREDPTENDKTDNDEEETRDSSINDKEENKDEELQDNNETLGDIVQTGDYGERMLVIRNITLLLLLAVIISMLVVKKEEVENR